MHWRLCVCVCVCVCVVVLADRLSEVRRVDVDVRVKFGVATLENLLSAVATTEASVLHLSCHAAGESSSDHVLVLENEYGAGDAVSAQRLEQLCRQVAPSGTKLDLVVVSACHSEVSAQAFVTANVKSIIAVRCSRACVCPCVYVCVCACAHGVC